MSGKSHAGLDADSYLFHMDGMDGSEGRPRSPGDDAPVKAFQAELEAGRRWHSVLPRPIRRRLEDREQHERWVRARLELVGPHMALLDKAAGIASVSLTCHRDTWVFIQTAMGQEVGELPDGDMVRAKLSGPRLVDILTRMDYIIYDEFVPGERLKRPAKKAIAGRVYDAIATVVGAVDPAAKNGAPVPDIVIDDRIARSDES